MARRRRKSRVADSANRPIARTSLSFFAYGPVVKCPGPGPLPHKLGAVRWFGQTRSRAPLPGSRPGRWGMAGGCGCRVEGKWCRCSARCPQPPATHPLPGRTVPRGGGSQRLIRAARRKVGVAHSRAKRAMLKTIHACATQKTPKPPESEPHTVRLTFACRASKPCPSLTAALGQKESSKKKLARQKSRCG